MNILRAILAFFQKHFSVADATAAVEKAFTNEQVQAAVKVVGDAGMQFASAELQPGQPGYQWAAQTLAADTHLPDSAVNALLNLAVLMLHQHVDVVTAPAQ